MADAILNQPQFQDPDKAREYLEALRWPAGPVCPHCGSVSDKHLHLSGPKYRAGLFKCADCYEQFTVTVGTVFERSKIGLHLWLMAVHLMCASKKGISAKQLERMLGVTYKTAWFMAHRIREAMKEGSTGMLGGGGSVVEADETYMVPKKGAKKNHAGHHRAKVVSLVSREGKTRSFHVANVDAKNLKPILTAHIAADTHLMTDGAQHYKAIGREFDKHESTNHSKGEYAKKSRKVRGRTVHSNTVEAYFSILKRGIVGTFHHVSEAHLQRYVNEFDFRFSNRESLGYSDTDRANAALKQISGKRLTYRRTDSQAASLQ